MPYGTIKVDTITFTAGGVDTSVSISGLVQNPTFTGNITSTGTISGNIIQGGTTVSGATVTGTAGQFGTLTGNTAGFTTVTGTTITGTTANLVTVSGTTITGDTARFTTLTGISGVFTTAISGATVTGNTGQFTVVTGGTAGFTTVTGTTVTGTTANFTTLSGTTVTGNAGSFTTVTGGVTTITSGVFAAGTEALPSISFSSDPNTGIFSPGADQVAISTNGSGRLFVNSSGYTSIGNSSPQALVHFGAGTSAPAFGTASSLVYVCTAGQTEVQLRTTVNDVTGSIYTDSNGVNVRAASAHPLSFLTSNTERLRITSAGLVGIGTTSPSSLLHVSGANADIRLTDTNVTNATWRILAQTGGSTKLFRIFDDSNSADRLVIDSSGRVGIGTTSPKSILTANGNIVGLNAGTHSWQHYQQASSAYTVTSIDSVISGASGSLVFKTGTNWTNADAIEQARIDSSGRLLVGTSTARSFFSGNDTPGLQVEGTSTQGRELSVTSSTNTLDGAVVLLGKQRSGTLGGNTIVQNGDQIGYLGYQASDGTKMLPAAAIIAEVDGTPGANDMPGRLVFSTTADGASSPTERGRINSSGATKFTTSASYRGSGTAYHEFTQGNQSDICLVTYSSNASYNSEVQRIQTARSASSLFSFLLCDNNVNVSGDTEFNLRGDGNGYCDGSWAGGGADYAEYFEWSDANPEEEDRRGISVVLDGDKIREAVAGEDPIGVISGNPSVVGDAAWNKWSGKYLRDEFGTYIQEDYEVTDEDGNTVIQQRRKLNPAYDADQQYIPREQRPEWDCVGLMGKLRIRKGQVTGSRWIKMRDISDSVEEWLVR